MQVSPEKTPIGFVGLGVMGKAMALNLLKAGFKLTVCNRSPEKVAEVVAEGATDGGSPADVAAASEVVFVCVPDTPDVETVLFGPGGIVEGAKEGTIVIDNSTISATATVEFAARLKERGIFMIDSPVSGGPQGAVNGTLSCMIGGETEAVERCMPAFEAVGKTFVHLGPSGAGQVTKACNQLIICATMMGMSEAVALCRKMDIDPSKMRDALLGGAAQSFVMQNHCKRLIDRTLDPGFRATLMLKDIKLAAAAGRDEGVFMPVTNVSSQMLGALCSTGRAGMDSAAVGLVFQELSGLDE